MKRAGAVLGVAVMLAVAFVVRGGIPGSDDRPGDGGSGDRLLCPDDLADACETAAGDVRVERAGATADALIEATDPGVLDGRAWIVPRAWAELVIAEREFQRLEPWFEIAEREIASSPVVTMTWADQIDELSTACDTIDWNCIAEEPDVGFRIRPGTPETDSALGLAVAVAQAADLLDRTDFGSQDFDPQFDSRVGRLATEQTADPVTVMRTQGPAGVTMAGTVRALAATSDTVGRTIEVTANDPAVRVDLVILVARGDGVDGGVVDRLAEAFTDAGWGPPAGGPDGLPAGGVIAAVRTLWNDS